MPRSPIDQGLIVGGAIVGGAVAGAAASLAIDLVPRPLATPLLGSAGMASTGARQLTPDAGDSTARGWTEFATEITAAVALANLIDSDRNALVKVAGSGAMAVSVAETARDAISTQTDIPTAEDIATSAAVGIGAAAAFTAATGLVRGGGLLARRLAAGPLARSALSLAGSAAVAAGIGFALKKGAATAFAKISAGNRATEVAYADPPQLPTAGGGPRSEIPFSTLGLQGRRFVSCTSSPSSIRDVTGATDPKAPVRVYVGVATAPTPEERVEAAIRDLDRLGGFERSRLLAACPAGTGYVNYITAEALEYLTDGDCATVAIQYGSLPSMLSLGKLDDAANVYALLLRRLREEIDSRGSGAQLLAYGESLGAIAGQEGTRRASDGNELIIDLALWVGTPNGSQLFEQLTSEGTPVFDSPADLNGLEPGVVTFLNHDNDPVTKFAASDMVEMPPWLEPKDRGRGTSSAQHWLPVVSFFQGLIDTKNAATVIPGEFRSTGHDYRADLASFISFAYGLPADSERMERVEDALRASEIDRATSIGLGKLQSA